MPGLEIERAKQVFRFLKAFAQRKLPIRRTLSEQLWQLRLRDLPKHSSIAIGIIALSDGDNVDDQDTTAQEPLIRVRRPPLTSPPGPPISIAEWLESAWKTPDRRIEALQSRIFQSGWRDSNRRLHGKPGARRSAYPMDPDLECFGLKAL